MTILRFKTIIAWPFKVERPIVLPLLLLLVHLLLNTNTIRL
jgi:hypothetical protein